MKCCNKIQISMYAKNIFWKATYLCYNKIVKGFVKWKRGNNLLRRKGRRFKGIYQGWAKIILMFRRFQSKHFTPSKTFSFGFWFDELCPQIPQNFIFNRMWKTILWLNHLQSFKTNFLVNTKLYTNMYLKMNTESKGNLSMFQ